MDVRCERCSTEYEFDDALVSGRGTTVKCTNCGHKFKIRRQDGDFAEDFWNVVTADGRTLVFTSLRELQRAIQTHLVERTDKISRGGLPPKPIGQIPELAPFFDLREGAKKSLPPPSPEAIARRSSRPPPPPGSVGPVLAAPPRVRQSTRPDFPAPPPPNTSMRSTLLGTGALDEPPPSEPKPATPAPPEMRKRMSSVPPPLPASARPAAPPPEPKPEPVIAVPTETPAPPPFEASSPLPPPAPAVIRAMEEVESASFSEAPRQHMASLPDAPTSMGRRRSVGGYIVVTVLLAGAGLIAAVWAKDHLAPAKPAPVATTDPRVAGFLEAGDKALGNGDLDLARESFAKASAVGEKDPRVLIASARLAATLADAKWLTVRLLPESQTDEIAQARASLGQLSQAARKAADDAVAAAPDDVPALRAKIDALRLSGDRSAARALVSRIASSSAQPETAYVLAVLDLGEEQPLWSTVIEPLRVAASGEIGPGRARAALVYALARSGDVAGARVELGRLESMPRRSELFGALKSFTERQKLAAGADAGTFDASAPPVPSGKVDVHAAGGGGGAGGGDSRPMPTDPRVLVAHGEAARQKGDYDRATQLFQAALDKNAGDTEALSGLAAVAYARKDLNGARASYKRVLSINPSYVPALVGVADCDWDSGDRSSAMKTYKDIIDRFPEGTYPGRVKMRVESAAPPPPPAPPPAPAPPPPAPAPTPESQ